MQTGLTILIVLLAALGQALAGPVRIAGEMPLPLLAGTALFYALNRPLHTGLVIAFATGLLQDALGMLPLGYSAVLFCLAAAAISRFQRTLQTESLLTGAVFGCATVVVLQAVTAVLLLRNSLLDSPGAVYVLRKIAGSGLLAALAVPLLFWAAATAHHAVTVDRTRDRA